MRALRILGGVAAGLAAVALVAPLVVPIPALADTVPPESLADAESRFVDVELSGASVRVHYKTAGTRGTAIVLLHGFGASLFSWREAIGPLGGIGRAVAYDRPGFGLTSRPLPGEWTDASPYGAEAQVKLVVALLDRLGVERGILVGHSAGGTVAMGAALAHPERVAGLVLVDAAIYVGAGGPSWLRPIYETPQMRRVGPAIARSLVLRAGQRLIDLSWHDPSNVTPGVVDGYRTPLRARDWDRGLWEVVRTSSMAGLAGRLREVTAPTLVITGDDDRIVPTEQSVRLARELPHARLVVIPDCGHVPQEECPGPFLDAVRTFVAELEAAERDAIPWREIW